LLGLGVVPPVVELPELDMLPELPSLTFVRMYIPAAFADPRRDFPELPVAVPGSDPVVPVAPLMLEDSRHPVNVTSSPRLLLRAVCPCLEWSDCAPVVCVCPDWLPVGYDVPD
jgi:hypothetical protein